MISPSSMRNMRNSFTIFGVTLWENVWVGEAATLLTPKAKMFEMLLRVESDVDPVGSETATYRLEVQSLFRFEKSGLLHQTFKV